MNKYIELKDTVDWMNSSDYRNRFIAEYYQTKIRYDKLHNMIVKYEANTLDFTPNCSIDLLKEQASYMGKYLYCLEVRAQIEKIDLNNCISYANDTIGTVVQNWNECLNNTIIPGTKNEKEFTYEIDVTCNNNVDRMN